MHTSTRLTLPRLVLLTIVGLITTQTQLAGAQVNAGATVLQFPIIARATAMGETGVADNSDPANIYFNPANVVGRPGLYVQGTRWSYDEDYFSEDIWNGSGSVGISFRRGDGSRPMTLSASLAYGRLDYGDVYLFDPDDAHTFEHYLALTLGAGFEFEDRWSLRFGVAGKRWSPNFPQAEFGQEDITISDAHAFDFGATGALLLDLSGWDITPAFALAIVNNGSEIEVSNGFSDDLPTRLHVGTSVRIESPTTTIFSAAVPVIAVVTNIDATDRWNGDDFSFGIGGELAVAQILFVRAGTSDFETDGFYVQRDSSGWGLGLGLPVASFRARFDYTRTTNYNQDDHFGFAVNWLF